MTLPQSYFSVRIWSDHTRTTLLNTATRVMLFRNTLAVDQVGQVELTCPLTDPNTAGFSKTTYVEIFVGAPTQTLWAAGYVQSVTRNVARSNEFQLVLASPMIDLADMREGGALFMHLGMGYNGILDYLNGLNAPGTGASPGQKGVLTGTGATARYIDGITVAVRSTTTAGGTVAVGNTAIGVTSSAGFTQWNAIRVNGTDIYTLSSINSGVNISIHPASFATYPAGTLVEDLGYQLPGTNTVGMRADWQTKLLDVRALMQDYGIHCREAAGGIRTNWTLQVGQFGDDSHLAVHGGNALLGYQQAHGYPTLAQPNIHYAQTAGLSVIVGPQYQDDESHIQNIVWGIGHGSAGKFTDLHTYWPTGVNPASFYQPFTGGKVYYLGATYSVTTLGRTKTYTLVAEQQNDGKYAYGVMDQTSVTKYGPHEGMVIDHTLMTPDQLLKACLQSVDQYSDPIGTWVLPVKHAMNTVMDANRVPPKVLPGQKITVNYSGIVAAVDTDTNPASRTYGQLIPTGANYSYLTFPPTNDPTYPLVSRCMKIVEEWNGHQFTATYTLGRGHHKAKHYYEDLLKKIITNTTKPFKKHSFVKHSIDQVPFWTSVNPTVWEDPQTGNWNFPAGGLAVTDVEDGQVFSDQHAVTFTVTLNDTGQDIWFLFGKDYNAGLTSLNAGSVYGVFRIAGPTSANATQFLSTSNGTTITAHGQTHAHVRLDHNNRLTTTGTYTVHMRWHGNKIEAMMSGPDIGAFNNITTPMIVATWNDTALALNKYGAIGFYVTGGTAQAVLTRLHAHPAYFGKAPRGSTGRHSLHTHLSIRKARRKNAAQGNGGGGGAGLMKVV